MCAFIAAIITLCAIPRHDWKIEALFFVADYCGRSSGARLSFSPELPWYHFIWKYRPIHLIGYVDKEQWLLSTKPPRSALGRRWRYECNLDLDADNSIEYGHRYHAPATPTKL